MGTKLYIDEQGTDIEVEVLAYQGEQALVMSKIGSPFGSDQFSGKSVQLCQQTTKLVHKADVKLVKDG